MTATSVMWFRRDLRLADNPALLAAADSGPDGVVPLFVFDDRLWGPAGEPRRGYLLDSLADLGARVGGMQLRSGDPVEEVVATARTAGAGVVHVSADFNPYGRRRDEAVERALAGAGLELRRSGSPYAVAPGRIGRSDERSGETQGYQVFSPFFRAWTAHGWRGPAAEPADVAWIRPLPNAAVPTVAADLRLPPAGEAAALARWHEFRDGPLTAYADRRDVPGVDATSRLSVHLKWGEIHPRTLLADLAQQPGPGADTFRSELAWREFYADVLWRRPETARDYLRPQLAALPYAEPGGPAFDAWRDGRTGYPIVDAAMRQLRQEHWMHNRARMIVASFLVKDLHIEWQHGARHFMRYLMDGDLASNQHGWQWTAGSGTDPAPFFRVFNPTTQGKKFDPRGSYVRRYVAELADVPDDFVHEPWRLPGGPPRGYPAPIVDHAEERKEALRRYELIR